MRKLSQFLLAALLAGTAVATQAAGTSNGMYAQRSPADYRAGKQYGQEYAAQTAEQYGYGTPTYYSQIENEDNYAQSERNNPNSSLPPDYWKGVQIGLYSN